MEYTDTNSDIEDSSEASIFDSKKSIESLGVYSNGEVALDVKFALKVNETEVMSLQFDPKGDLLA